MEEECLIVRVLEPVAMSVELYLVVVYQVDKSFQCLIFNF